MKKSLIICVALQALSTVSFSQNTPTAKELFNKMKAAVSSIRTLSYESEYVNYNSGLDDSISISKGSIWLKAIPDDTIFKTHFHVAYNGKNGYSDYFYDGTNAIDIWHKHAKTDLEKTITVLEPILMGNGYNRVQSRVSVLPYFNELTNIKALSKWLEKDSILVTEDASKKHWILEWNENNIADNFYATRQIFVDKSNNFITKMHRKSLWNGTRGTQDLHIRSMQVNRDGDEDFVTLKQSYPDYKTTYVSNKSASKSAEVFSFAGQKAKDFSYRSFTGENISLKAAKGKFMLLDFWETWCGYCYLAMPRLKDLQKKYREQLDIVGIVTENKGGVQQVINAQRFPYPTVYADQKLLDSYKVQGRPTYLLIDDKGTIVEHSIGSLDKIEKSIIDRLNK
ncbi:MAG TPA: TlpA disulfide reductase family protein [Segetibacter sp.]